uniref:Legume lectin domain-containing protein n=1 Tax=Ananas comosus var. bracteatus TaxID=296719 RepID=A0A6V7NJM2_ANACO|nr:unnamed protein product [Ananas comosus var. bracteatus]
MTHHKFVTRVADRVDPKKHHARRRRPLPLLPLDPRRIKPILASPSPAASSSLRRRRRRRRLLRPPPRPLPLPSPSLPSPSHSSASCSAPPSPPTFSLPSLLRSCASSSPLLALASTLSPSAAASSPPPRRHLPPPLLRCLFLPRPPPHALQLFDEMPRRTTVTFNALLSRLARYSDAGRAHGLLLFSRMLSSGPTPNADTLAAALLCCAGLGALALGRAAHALAARRGAARAPQLGTSLVHMYAKCGSLDSARRVFDRAMPARDASAWTAMIAALAAHARGEDAVHLFDEMVGRENLSPDSLTFTCALHACANSGMAERGLKLFDEMQSVYGIKPRMEHYGAIVDLLGRAGRIDAAERVVSSMPFEPNCAVWGALLHACAHNADSALAEKLGKRISELGLGLGFDVGVSNLYARVGRWEESERERERERDGGTPLSTPSPPTSTSCASAVSPRPLSLRVPCSFLRRRRDVHLDGSVGAEHGRRRRRQRRAHRVGQQHHLLGDASLKNGTISLTCDTLTSGVGAGRASTPAPSAFLIPPPAPRLLRHHLRLLHPTLHLLILFRRLRPPPRPFPASATASPSSSPPTPASSAPPTASWASSPTPPPAPTPPPSPSSSTPASTPAPRHRRQPRGRRRRRHLLRRRRPARDAGVDLKEGVPMTAWVDYQASRKTLRVWLGYSRSRPPRPLLVARLDLSALLREFMYVGFSASNGRGAALHLVDSWSFRTFGFSSSSPSAPPPPSSPADANDSSSGSGSDELRNSGDEITPPPRQRPCLPRLGPVIGALPEFSS